MSTERQRGASERCNNDFQKIATASLLREATNTMHVVVACVAMHGEACGPSSACLWVGTRDMRVCEAIRGCAGSEVQLTKLPCDCGIVVF